MVAGLSGGAVGQARWVRALWAATVQARVLPRWHGVLLIIFMPILLVLGVYGNIWRALVLGVLGYGLWMHRGHRLNEPSV